MKKLMIGAVVLLLAGCSALGVPTAKTFNQKWLAAQQTDTTVLQEAIVLEQAGKISKEDLANIEGQTDNVKAGLDIARMIYATDQTAGNTKLTAVLAVLQAAQAYVTAKEPKQ